MAHYIYCSNLPSKYANVNLNMSIQIHIEKQMAIGDKFKSDYI